MFNYFLSLFLPFSLLVSNIFPQSENGTFAISTRWATGKSGTIQFVGDFNGDGLTDKLRVDEQNNFWVALSNATSFDKEVDWTTTQDTASAKHYIGDFNGDGLDDIITYQFTSGIWKAYLADQSLKDGHYYFKAPVQWNKQGTILFEKINKHYIGDFNGDGVDDVMTYSDGWKVATSNGQSFNTPETWKTSGKAYPGPQDSTDKIFVADLDGDGDCDIAIYKYSVTGYKHKDNWFVLKSNAPASSFSDYSLWSDGQGAGSIGPFFGDVNGDGKKDKINFYSETGQWYVAISNSAGTGFEVENQLWWHSEQSVSAIAGFAGDFNGDELCDAAFLKSNGEWWVGINTSPRPTPDHKKIVATWFSIFYSKGQDLYNNKRDQLKVPLVGWGSRDSTIAGIYNSKDRNVIDKQIDAMIKAGINLIIVDRTNGWRFDNGDLMQTHEHEATDSLFWVMKKRKDNGLQWIPITIGLGYEFWGKIVYDYYHKRNGDGAHGEWIWKNWAKQFERQKIALNDIYVKYTSKSSQYKDIYFYYLNRPLVIAYIAAGEDYPPRDINGNDTLLWYHNTFTIKTAINWASTFGYYRDSLGIFVNGMDTKRFWGWGARWSLDNPQPYNVECISVMPGTYVWYDTTIQISREREDYYSNSWKRIIEVNPNIAIIADWNNWNEETAIEGCIGSEGWKDYYGNDQYDWYLQITQAYSKIFRDGVIPSSTYIRDEENINVYLWDGKTAILQNKIPHNKPVVILPHNWGGLKLH